MAPTLDYEALLATKGLKFTQENGEKLMTLDDQPLPPMSQQEFEQVGNLVMGYV